MEYLTGTYVGGMIGQVVNTESGNPLSIKYSHDFVRADDESIAEEDRVITMPSSSEIRGDIAGGIIGVISGAKLEGFIAIDATLSINTTADGKPIYIYLAPSTIYGVRSAGGAVGMIGAQNAIMFGNIVTKSIIHGGTLGAGGILGYYLVEQEVTESNPDPMLNNVIFYNCVFEGEIYNDNHPIALGGLIGTVYNVKQLTVSNCYSREGAQIIASGSGDEYNVGGLIGLISNVEEVDIALACEEEPHTFVVSGSNATGGLVGSLKAKNVIIRGQIRSIATIKADMYAGGLIGYAEVEETLDIHGVAINNDSEIILVEGSNSLGTSEYAGLVGYIKTCGTLMIDNISIYATDYQVTANTAGGIIGSFETINSISITNISINANTKITGIADAGGIIGKISGRTENDIVIGSTQSSNIRIYANIESKNAGALIGSVSNIKDYSLDVNNFYGTPIITATINAGGLIGLVDNSNVNIFNSTITARINNNVSVEDITTTQVNAGGMVGAIAGDSHVVFAGANVNGGIVKGYISGGVVGHMASESTIESFAISLQGVNVSAYNYAGGVVGKMDNTATDLHMEGVEIHNVTLNGLYQKSVVALRGEIVEVNGEYRFVVDSRRVITMYGIAAIYTDEEGNEQRVTGAVRDVSYELYQYSTTQFTFTGGYHILVGNAQAMDRCVIGFTNLISNYIDKQRIVSNLSNLSISPTHSIIDVYEHQLTEGYDTYTTNLRGSGRVYTSNEPIYGEETLLETKYDSVEAAVDAIIAEGTRRGYDINRVKIINNIFNGTENALRGELERFLANGDNYVIMGYTN